jgi:AcrR family transcriptional regulator
MGMRAWIVDVAADPATLAVLPPSTKQQIVLTAERLFAEQGLDGVSLRQLAAAAGNANKSAVRYHFGSKERLIQAIFEYRLPALTRRRQLLIAERRPADLRSWVACYLRPVMEQAEQDDSHYLTFVVQLHRYGAGEHPFDRLPEAFKVTTYDFIDRLRAMLPDIPEPLRTHRISRAMTFWVHASSDRERARQHGSPVLPFAVEVSDLLDGLIGFLEAPVSADALSALDGIDLPVMSRLVVP